MKNRFLGSIYVLLLSSLVVSAITEFDRKGFSVIGMSLVIALLYFLPAILERLLGIIIPPLLKYMILAFLFLCLQMGGILSFYKRFDGWDSFIHLLSGFLSATLGLSLINILNKNPMSLKTLNPGFVFLFILLFSAGVSLLWEYNEFFSDSLFGTNHLNDTLLANGQVDIGLMDTMKDLLLSHIASIFTAFCHYRSIRKGKWFKLSRLLIHKSN